MSLHRRRLRGSVLIYSVIGMTAFVALASLAIDIAHVRLVKTQLQTAADAAARAAAQNLQSGVTAASNAAVAAAASNSADGRSVVINTGTDLDFGTWSNGTFTVLSGPGQSAANAVRVRCTRSSNRGNAVTTAFGGLIGINSSNLTAQAVATGTTTPMAGFIGYAGVDMKNNTYFASYNSSILTNPNQNNTSGRLRVGSNTYITGQNNGEINGDVVLGPGATVGGITVIGTTVKEATAIPSPTIPAWAPGTNPGNLSQTYVVSSNTTLAGGTYWFNSLTVNANLTFSGSAVVYVNGPVAVGGTLAPTSGVPSDLKIYQYGSSGFGDSASNGMNITAQVQAPGSDFVAKNNLYYAGSGIFNSITTKNNAEFYFDEQQGAMNGLDAVATVQ
jgi:hypothetical protein